MKLAIVLLAACSLLAGPAGAQTAQEPVAPPKPPERPANERPALKLKLDEVEGGRARIGIGASERDPNKSLPSLGADARTLPTAPAGTAGSPFPKDTSQVR